MDMLPFDVAAGTPLYLTTLALDLNSDLVPGNDGDAVATWSNKSILGTAADFAQATGTKQPLIKRNVFNGHSAVRFDGSNDLVTSSWQRPEGAQTWFFVFALRSTPGAAVVWQPLQFVGSASADVLLFVNVGGYQPYSFGSKKTGAATTVGIADALDTSPHILCVTYNNGVTTSTGSYTCMLDGTTKTVVASGSANRSTAQGEAIGDLSAGGDAVPMDLARVLLFSAVLSTNDLAAMQQYLHNYYGI